MSPRARNNAEQRRRLAEKQAQQQQNARELAQVQQETARQHRRARHSVCAATVHEARFIAQQSGAHYETVTACYEERGPQRLDPTNGNLPFDDRYIPKQTTGGTKRIAELNHQLARLASAT